MQPTGCGEYVRRRRISLVINDLCPRGGLVVDVGGGKGTLRTALRADLRPRYTAVDITTGRHGRRIVGDVSNVPLRPAVADVVCLSDVLEHVADDGAVVREAARLLRIGGHLVVHVPSLRGKPFGFIRRAADEAEESDHQTFPHVRDGYDAASLRALLGRVPGMASPTIEPSFTAIQSLVADIDAYLWWRRLLPARAVTWAAIRLVSSAPRRPGDQASSGVLGTARRTV